MLHKVDEIRGALLDAAVALAEGLDLGPDWDQDWKHGSGALVRSASDHPYFDFAPSTNWAQGGPIIERRRIDVCTEPAGGWRAASVRASGAVEWQRSTMPLVAAMRAYVASTFGTIVELPD